ncbi:MAG: aldo/keto reductase [Lachnospiraceae bacterium]|nr:aldo/keto reductase [Lachnospiraceae bacterium]
MKELANFNEKKLGFGCMRLPVIDGDMERIDDELFCKMVDTFMEQGFTYFDTAYPYHNQKSEGAVKRCLVDRYDRDKFYLADKMPMWSAKEYADYERIFAEQLERCGVEYFDFYLLHALYGERYEEGVKLGAFEFVQKMKAEGKIKHVGFSFHDTAEVLDKILTEHPEMEFVQLQINYYDWESENVQSRKCYEVAVKHGVPVIVMEPVKGGTLASLAPQAAAVLDEINPKASYASFAVRYAASLEHVFMVLSGMSDYEQLVDNTSYMKDFAPLTEEEQAGITRVVEELTKLPTIPCTKCRYCVDGCPQKINIPALFQAHNNVIQFGDNAISRRSYESAVKEHGLASSCVECGLCEEQCPQHLEIRSLLKDVAKMFE